MKKLLLIFSFVVLCLSVGAQVLRTYPPYLPPVATGGGGAEIRVAQYKFTQNPNDSYSTNNGTNQGSMTYQTYGSFDGYIIYECSDANYITLPSIAYGNTFTITFRLLFEDFQLDHEYCILNCLYGAGFGNGFQIVFNSGGANTIKVITYNGSGDGATATSTDADLAFNTIHNVAVTFNRTAGTVKIYTNATDRTSSATIRTDFTSTRTGSVAKDNGPWETSAWPQPLDEIQIYNVELTQSEVTWQQSNPNTMVTR